MIPHFNEREIDGLRQQLSKPNNIAIVMHYKPDGDAMGSALALYDFLLGYGHNAKVVAPSKYPEFLFWLPGNNNVINFETDKTQAETCLLNADIIFVLDFNDAARVEAMQDALLQSDAIKVMIDHHLQPTDFCDVAFSFHEASSTCELVYRFMYAMYADYKLTLEAAQNIYTGILTDTGSFKFSSTTGDVHRIIAHLIDVGVIPNEIHEYIYDNFSESRTRFLGYCLQEKLVVVARYNVAYIGITKDALKHFNHETGDTEGIVNYALGIKGMRMAAFFTEQDNGVKISFRSKGSFSVKALAAAHFNGGGHQNAAGGKSTENLDQTIAKFLALLPFYENQLL